MVVRLTHGKKRDVQDYTYPALGRSFSLTGVAAGLRKASKLALPDKIPYLLQGQPATVSKLPPVWGAAQTFSLTEGVASGPTALNVSVPGGGSPTITVAWHSSSVPSTKPDWITLTSGTAPTISFTTGSLDSEDVSSMVISATANGSAPVLSSAGTVTVSAAGGSATPFRVVRTNQSYATLQGAVNGAISGDTIRVTPGTYVISSSTSPGSIFEDGNFPNNASAKWYNSAIMLETLTIEAENISTFQSASELPLIDAAAFMAASYDGGGNGFKAGETLRNLTLRGIRVKGAGVASAYGGINFSLPGYPNQNGATAPATSLTVEHCYFEDFSNGVITSSSYNAVGYIRYSSFPNCGKDTSNNHNVYFGAWSYLEVTGCTFANTEVKRGHNFKSRAKVNVIRGCLFKQVDDNTDYLGRCLDISNGGDLTITGCVMISGQNNQVIAFGPEQTDSYYNHNPASWGTSTSENTWVKDGRTHSIKLAQNTIRHYQQYFPNNPTEIIKIFPNLVAYHEYGNNPDSADPDPDGGAPDGHVPPYLTVTTTDDNGSMIRNNIVVGNTTAAATFGSLYANNTVETNASPSTRISDAGVYAGTPVVCNPSVSDAIYAYSGELTVPYSRNDLYRGGKIVGTALYTAAAQTASRSWNRFRISGQSGLTDALLKSSNNASILAYLDRGKYEPNSRKLLFIGKGAGPGTEQKFIQYDEISDLWSEILPKPPWTVGFGHGYCHNAVNAATGDYYYRVANDGTVWKKVGTTWTQLPSPSYVYGFMAGGLEWFPNANRLFMCGAKQAFVFNGSSWTELSRTLNMGDIHAVAQYSAAHGCVYFGGGNSSTDGLGFYRLNSNLEITDLSPAPFSWGVNQTYTAIEPVSGDLLVFVGSTWARFNGTSWTYPYTPGTGGDGLPLFTLAEDGCVTYTMSAPYNCIVFLRRNGTSPDMWIYKD